MSQAGASGRRREPNYEILRNKLGGNLLLHGGHAYTMHRQNKNSSIWTCNRKKTLKCGGSVKLDNDNDLVNVQRLHTSLCAPDHLKNEVRKTLCELAEEVGVRSEPIRKLFEEKMTELKKKGLVASKMPAYQSVRTTLYRSRKQKLNANKKWWGEVKEIESHADLSQVAPDRADLSPGGLRRTSQSQDSPRRANESQDSSSEASMSPDSPIVKSDPEGEDGEAEADPILEPEQRAKVRKPKKKKRRRRSNSSVDQRQDEEAPEAPGGSGDSDRLFLLSFLPEMRRLPPNIKMWARTRIANVMQEAVTYHYENLPLPDVQDIKHISPSE